MITGRVPPGLVGPRFATGVKLGAVRASEPAPYSVLESRIGYAFIDRSLCEAALTHKSWLNERHGTARTDIERLEFRGAAVLALAVSDMLMRRFPERSEGELSKTRAALVSEAGLTKAAE